MITSLHRPAISKSHDPNNHLFAAHRPTETVVSFETNRGGGDQQELREGHFQGFNLTRGLKWRSGDGRTVEGAHYRSLGFV